MKTLALLFAGGIGMLALQLLLIVVINKGSRDVLFDSNDHFVNK